MKMSYQNYIKIRQEKKMEINFKFEYKDLTTNDLVELLQGLQEEAIRKGGMVYSISKLSDKEESAYNNRTTQTEEKNENY